MAESLVHTILGLFDGLNSIPHGKELIVFIISLMPILELRGGLIAAALLGLDIVPAFIICLIGNLLPLPFILWFITPIFNRLKKTKHLSKLVTKLENKALAKKDKIEKAEFWGLLFFVGIPLLKEEMENQNYREQCRRRGYDTYWSTDGLRYTSTNRKFYK